MTSASAEVVLIAGDTNQQRVYWAGELGLLSDPDFKVVYVTGDRGSRNLMFGMELFVVGEGVSDEVEYLVGQAKACGLTVHYFGKDVRVLSAPVKFPPLTGKNAKITLPSGEVLDVATALTPATKKFLGFPVTYRRELDMILAETNTPVNKT